MSEMPTKAEIVRTFEIYNATLFGGRLELPDILVRRMNDCARWYEPEPDMRHTDKPGRTRGLLVISSSALHRMTWRGTLLHEMIHIAVPEHENDFHGPLFTAECNRVGVLIGLEPVDVHDAWNWPAHHLDHEEDDPNILDEEEQCPHEEPRSKSASRRKRAVKARARSGQVDIDEAIRIRACWRSMLPCTDGCWNRS